MTLIEDLADRALGATTDGDRDRLRSLTLTNLAAAAGSYGRAAALIDRFPLERGAPGAEAFLLGMRLHARTQDDFHPSGRIHVGAVTLAVVLALRDQAGDRTLEALAAGYETMCAVASAYSPEAQRRGMRPTGVFGPIGAAASAAVALGLDRDGVANAIGLAAARSGGTMQAWLSGSDEWMLEIGAAARAGVEAALFTRAGAVASAEAFEGGAGWLKAYFGDADPTALAAAVARPGSYIAEVAVKPYPVSGIAQVPTGLACLAHDELGGAAAGAVTGGPIVIRLSERESAYPGTANRGPFRSRSDALMSISFCIACGLSDGTVRLDRLEAPNELGTLVSRVELRPDSSLGEEEAILEVGLNGDRRTYQGAGASLLYPAWSTIAAEGQGLARRSEAEPALVGTFAGLLGEPRPDASRIATALGGIE